MTDFTSELKLNSDTDHNDIQSDIFEYLDKHFPELHKYHNNKGTTYDDFIEYFEIELDSISFNETYNEYYCNVYVNETLEETFSLLYPEYLI